MSNFLKLMVAGGAVRLLFVLIGTFVDALPMRLKYTDVDYSVFSDAGKLLAAGRKSQCLNGGASQREAA